MAQLLDEDEIVERISTINDILVPPTTIEGIVVEAKATRGNLRLGDAILILVFERWERGILTKRERDYLVDRIYS